jgi:hypothetical protein
VLRKGFGFLDKTDHVRADRGQRMRCAARCLGKL